MKDTEKIGSIGEKDLRALCNILDGMESRLLSYSSWRKKK